MWHISNTEPYNLCAGRCGNGARCLGILRDFLPPRGRDGEGPQHSPVGGGGGTRGTVTEEGDGGGRGGMVVADYKKLQLQW